MIPIPKTKKPKCASEAHTPIEDRILTEVSETFGNG